jgi:acetolactate synthase-1/2/3 large subunit
MKNGRKAARKDAPETQKSRHGTQMTGAEMVVQALADQGVTDVFGYPGGAVLPIYDEIFQQERVKHILVRHEQGAGHAAEGYARSTGKPGVVLVTSGPGATNAWSPALADALMDSIPMVCITGQVPTHLIGNDAFQECDTVGITRPCDQAQLAGPKNVNDLARILHEAFYVARPMAVPGPVRGRRAEGRPVRDWHLCRSRQRRAQELPSEAPSPTRRRCAPRSI